MAAVNDTRQVQMTVDLGGEQVAVERVRHIEELGKLFSLQVDIVATLAEFDLLPHLGKPIAIHLYEDDQVMRHFHGVIVAGEFREESGAGFHYRLTARPAVHMLAHNQNMAIFQDLTAPQIIEEVLNKAGISDYRLDLSRAYRPRDYCVQYRESDLTFITRLMEEEGIFYYWEHSEDKHVMMLVDDSRSAPMVGGRTELTYNPDAGSVHRYGSEQRGGGDQYLESWGERVSTGAEAKVTLRAFDMFVADHPLEKVQSGDRRHPGDEQEVYDFPARFVPKLDNSLAPAARTNPGIAGDQAQLDLDARRRLRQTYAGRTQATNMACGRRFSVQSHPVGRLNRPYLIIRTDHVLQNEQYRSGGPTAEEGEEATRVTVEAIPATTPFHLPETTRKPMVQGLESAIITGPSGETIFTDAYGRVKAQFHWDRQGRNDERSSCWIRVAQFGGLGNVILPRVDQEVMVDFLHGNPDHPIIVGWVFNSKHKPIYELPKHKTRALWRTKSYPSGSTNYENATELESGNPGANELRFEDLSGHEEVYLHAEKDMNVRVRNDQTTHVGHNQTDKVFYDREAYVGRDEDTTIKRHQTLTIKEGQQVETIEKGDREVTIKMGNDTETVEMGDIKIKASLGKIEMEAMQSITLKVGGSSIVIDQIGVTIKGTVKVETKGVMIQSSADAMQVVKGGLVMIN